MKRATTEWVAKAEGDWKVARREHGVARPVWDAVCFHAQQCAEKYVKAVLEENEIAFPKTHDLVLLVTSSGKLLSQLLLQREALSHLSTVGIVARYPGTQADRRAAKDALRMAGEVRAVARRMLTDKERHAHTGPHG